MKKDEKKPVFYEEPNTESRIDHVYAIMSGKGGVGKSFVTAMTALAVQKRGWNVAILDADITGPSIPKSFGLSGGLEMRDKKAYARRSAGDVQIVSSNFLLSNETDPIIWKGPMVSQGIKQFWTDVIYENVDYLFVDMPPGTGDVPLTVFQTLPVEGIIIVTSPQDLVSMIVEKAVNMARMMGIPIVGVVENMSYFRAPDTGNVYKIFGESKIEEICKEKNLKLLAQLPINPDHARLVDAGRIEEVDTAPFMGIADEILTQRAGR